MTGTSFGLGLALGVVAALMMNIGKGIQKHKVWVLTKGRAMLSGEHRGAFLLWCLGLGVTTGAALPFSLGMKLSGSPSAISAMTGLGLTGLVFYANRFIGEKLGPSDVAGIVLVILGTSLLGYLGHGSPADRSFTDALLIKSLAALFAVAALGCVAALFWRRIHGVAFGSTAGLGIGAALFIGDAALVKAGGDFGAQLDNPYPYIAMGFATLAMVVTQFGFLRGRALEVVPAVNSATILTPIALELLIYGVRPTPLQLAITGVILTGVMLLSTGAAARVSATPPAPR
jgi:drug/metabolite transporter (DMT)-like permease